MMEPPHRLQRQPPLLVHAIGLPIARAPDDRRDRCRPNGISAPCPRPAASWGVAASISPVPHAWVPVSLTEYIRLRGLLHLMEYTGRIRRKWRLPKIEARYPARGRRKQLDPQGRRPRASFHLTAYLATKEYNHHALPDFPRVIVHTPLWMYGASIKPGRYGSLLVSTRPEYRHPHIGPQTSWRGIRPRSRMRLAPVDHGVWSTCTSDRSIPLPFRCCRFLMYMVIGSPRQHTGELSDFRRGADPLRQSSQRDLLRGGRRGEREGERPRVHKCDEIRRLVPLARFLQ